MLATAYDKMGRPADAIAAERQALDVARQQHDEEVEKHLQSNLERFEREGAAVQNQ